MRYQAAGLMKLSDRKRNRVATFSGKHFLASTRGTQETAQTVR